MALGLTPVIANGSVTVLTLQTRWYAACTTASVEKSARKKMGRSFKYDRPMGPPYSTLWSCSCSRADQMQISEKSHAENRYVTIVT